MILNFREEVGDHQKMLFNSMLSLGYTILMYTIYAEIENRGLSPYISFFIV